MGIRWFPIKRKTELESGREDRAEAWRRERFAAVSGLAHDALRSFYRLRRGTNAFLYAGEAQGWGKVLFRFFSPDEQKSKAQGHIRVAEILTELAIPTPRVLCADLSDEAARRYGFHVIVEEFVEGRPLAPALLLEAKWRRRLLSFLTRLHSREDGRAGRWWVPRNDRERPLRYFRSRVPLYVQRIRRSGAPPWPRSVQRAVVGWFAGRAGEVLGGGPPWQLICGDIHPDNFIAAAVSDQLYCIDKGTFLFGCFEEDLVQVEEHYMSGPDAVLDGGFWREYFVRFSDGAARQVRWERNRRFFMAWRALEKAASAAVKLGKVAEGRKSEHRRPSLASNLHVQLERLARLTGIAEVAPLEASGQGDNDHV
ncbi:MAG: hypothetical protein Kow0059_08290 [Candidatus Sumerlaeia bacterium]